MRPVRRAGCVWAESCLSCPFSPSAVAWCAQRSPTPHEDDREICDHTGFLLQCIPGSHGRSWPWKSSTPLSLERAALQSGQGDPISPATLPCSDPHRVPVVRDGEAELVAGWPHGCVIARCKVTERQTRERSVPAAGGSGRAWTIQRPHRNIAFSTTNINMSAQDKCRQAGALPLMGNDH